jgi:hypothetical protein
VTLFIVTSSDRLLAFVYAPLAMSADDSIRSEMRLCSFHDFFVAVIRRGYTVKVCFTRRLPTADRMIS